MTENTYLTYGECYQVMPRATMPGAGWCSTMERLKCECGCPDCGPSLINVGEGDVA